MKPAPSQNQAPEFASNKAEGFDEARKKAFDCLEKLASLSEPIRFAISYERPDANEVTRDWLSDEKTLGDLYPTLEAIIVALGE